MSKLFGTDGVRGIANQYPMTAEMVLKIGRAVAHVCRDSASDRRHKIVIGKDTRASGYMLENSLTAGICSMGVDVLLVGPMPTPGISFITRSMRADAGIVISASHNPFQDNGIKIFSRDGYKLPDATEAEIEDLIFSGRIQDMRPPAEEVGRARRIDDAIGRYIVFCKNIFPDSLSLEGLRIVIDCANGATYKIAPIIFSELGAEVLAIHNEPNGENINDHCGSQHPEDLIARVRETRADLGLAFDGDGDRLVAVDETGRILTGDHVLAILGKYLHEEGLLHGTRAVATVMSNFGLHRLCRELGIALDICGVGDRLVLEAMRQSGAVLGGEASGHIILGHHHTTGDGILAALKLLTVMRARRARLSSLADILQLSPQEIINVIVREKPDLNTVPEIVRQIREAEETLGEAGRVLVRYSGTQAMCRVMIEGPTREVTQRLATHIADAIRREIGA